MISNEILELSLEVAYTRRNLTTDQKVKDALKRHIEYTKNLLEARRSKLEFKNDIPLDSEARSRYKAQRSEAVLQFLLQSDKPLTAAELCEWWNANVSHERLKIKTNTMNNMLRELRDFGLIESMATKPNQPHFYYVQEDSYEL